MASSLGESILTIVIPTLNEEEAIGRVLEELLSEGYSPSQIIVVDGGSIDRTVEVAGKYGVKVIVQEGRGKGRALETALRHVKTEYTLVMDGDYTYPAKHVRKLLEKAVEGNYDQVIGARIFEEGGSQPLIFKIGNKILTKFFNTLFGVGLRDVLSGMYIVKTRILRDLEWGSKDFGIESEIAAHVASISGRITDIPVKYRRRIGRKKLKVVHGLWIARDMIKLAWRYNPTFLIFMLGALLTIPGLTLGAYVAYNYFFTGINYHVKGLVAIMLTLAGFQSLILALLSLYLKRVEYRFNRKISDLAEKLERK